MPTFNQSDTFANTNNWLAWVGSGLAVTGGQLYTSAANGTAVWAIWDKYNDKIAAGPDYYVQAPITRTTTNNFTVSLMARCFQGGGGSETLNQLNGLQCAVRRGMGTAGVDQIQFYAWVDSPGSVTGLTQIGTSQDVSWVDGDVLKFEVQGDTLRAYRNGSLVHTATLTGTLLTKFGDVSGHYGVRFVTDGGGASSGRVGTFQAGYLASPRNLLHYTVGAVSPTTAKIGFQTSHAADVRILYSTASDLSGASTSSTFTTSAGGTNTLNDDGTGVITLTGLTANTTYYFKVQLSAPSAGVWSDKLTYSGYGSFLTMPANGASGVYTFMVGSCFEPDPTPINGWLGVSAGIGGDSLFDQLVTQNPRFYLHIGDIIYSDVGPTGYIVETTVAAKRSKFRRNFTTGTWSNRYANFRKKYAGFHMYDDHEFVNDADATVMATQKAPTVQTFNEFVGQMNPSPVTVGEAYYTFSCGNIGFFVLDGRTFRSANSATDNSSKTCLGSVQKAALKSWLSANNSTYKVKFIVTTTTVSQYAGTDAWGGGFTTEVKEIWDYIIDNTITGVAFLSADQHNAVISKTAYRGKYFPEVMSSPFLMSLPSAPAAGIGGNLVAKYSGQFTAAMVTVDTTQANPQITFKVVNNAGTAPMTGTNPYTFLASDTGIVSNPVFPAGWKRKCPITIDGTKIAANLTNFSVVLTDANLPAEMLTTNHANAAQADGGDIRFSLDAAGTQPLACHVKTWSQNVNPALATAHIRVTIPSLTASVNKTIYVWYGHSQTVVPEPSAGTYGRSNAYETDTVVSYAFGSASSVDANDDGPSGNHGTLNGAPTAAAGVARSGALAVGGASTKYISLPASTLAMPVGYTLCGWVNLTSSSTGVYQALFSDAGTNNWLGVNPTGQVYGKRNGVAGTAGAAVGSGGWHFIALTRGAANGMKLYVDTGAPTVNATATEASSWGASQTIGGSIGFTFPLNGSASLAAAFSSEKSSGWVTTVVNNQGTPATFAAAGTPVSNNATNFIAAVGGNRTGGHIA